MAAQLLNVLHNCDTITYEEPGTPEAYAMIHFLNRYHRFQMMLCLLHQKRLMPTKKDGIDILDVGTGPGPSMYAVSDFYRKLLGAPDEGLTYGARPKFRIDYVERSDGFRNWLHQFTEYVNYFSLTDTPWHVPYHHGSFRDFSDISFNELVSYWDFNDNGGARIRKFTRRHRYDVIIISNFLTSEHQAQSMRDQLQSCVRFLRHGGIVLICGARDTSAKYQKTYNAIIDIIADGQYSNWKFIGNCNHVDIRPNVMSYQWNDPYGSWLKRQLKTVYDVLRSRYYSFLAAGAEDTFSVSMKPDYNKSISWQMMVFRKEARPRRRVRRTGYNYSKTASINASPERLG